MKDIQNMKEKGEAATMADVLVWAQGNGAISPATRADYIAHAGAARRQC